VVLLLAFAAALHCEIAQQTKHPYLYISPETVCMKRVVDTHHQQTPSTATLLQWSSSVAVHVLPRTLPVQAAPPFLLLLTPSRA
jgi:hypothetical protein